MTATFSQQEVLEIRKDFPILSTKANGKPLVYLDNAATSHKSRQCVEAISSYYTSSNANVHRGVHYLSEMATALYEDARATVATFINAPSPNNIVFVRGTTEAINLVAHGFSRKLLKEGDKILITELEHHSNIVPWQLACEYTGATLKVVPINDQGELDLEKLEEQLTDSVKLFATTYISNAIGTINPIKEMIALAKKKNVPVLVDGAQAAPHVAIDVHDLDCDFFAFSAHKSYGPTGTGVLYAKNQWLDELPPYQGGGEMIVQVSFDKSTYHKAPFKFEAGTPNIAGAVGYAAAIQHIQSLGLERINAYEQDLLDYAEKQLSTLPKFRVIGQAKTKASVISLTHENIHPHDMGTILDFEGIAVRAGHHCAMPLMEKLQLPATVRASMCFYNTYEEVDKLIEGLKQVEKIFS